MPSWARHLVLIGVLLTFLPLLLLARCRMTDSAATRIHVIRDMDKQGRYTAQGPGPLFADGRASRPGIEGTVPYGELNEDDGLHRGKSGLDWIKTIPLSLDAEDLKRGRERFNIYCAPCHGYAGLGDGMVSRRADQLQEGTWTPPSSLHTDLVRSRPAGHLFNTVSEGIRNMPAHASQIGVEDRWRIVAYVQALQLSRNGRLDDVPAQQRAALDVAEEGGR